MARLTQSEKKRYVPYPNRREPSGTYVTRPGRRTLAQRAQVRRDQQKALTPQSFAAQKPRASRAQAQRAGRRAVSKVFTTPNPVYRPRNLASTPRLKYFPVVRNLKDALAIAYHQSKVLDVAPVELTGKHAQDQIANVLKSDDANQRAAAKQLQRVIHAIDRYEKQHAPEIARKMAGKSYAQPGGRTGLDSAYHLYLQRHGMHPGRVLKEGGRYIARTWRAGGYAQQATERVTKNAIPDSITLSIPIPTTASLGAHGGGGKTATVRTRVPSNAVKDVISLPTSTVTGLYETGKVAHQAAKGNSRPAKNMWDDFKKTDPIALAAQGHFGKAIKAAGEHPVNTALEVSGIKSVIGHAAGGVLRHGTPAMRRVGSTVREDEVFYGDHRRPRRYSGDVITKGAQVVLDKLDAKGQRPRWRGQEHYRRKQVEKLADEQVSVGEGIRREHRNELIQDHMPEPLRNRVRDAAKHLNSTERGLVGLAIDNTFRSPETIIDDLLSYEKKLERARDEFKNADNPDMTAVRANAKLLKTVKKAIRDGVDSDQLFKAAQEYKKAYDATEADRIDRGLLEPGRAGKAVEVPYAVSHMGAKEMDLTPRFREHHGQLGKIAQRARATEDAAYRRWVSKRTGGGQAEQRDATFRDVLVGDEIKYGSGKSSRFYRVTKVLNRKGVGGKVAIEIDGRGRVLGSPTTPVRLRRQGRALADEAKNDYLAARAVRMDAEDAIKVHAKDGKRGMHLVDPEGNVLNAEAIRAHRESAGVKDPAFYGQRREQSMRNAAYVNKHPRRGEVGSDRRTGEASRKGTFAASHTDVYTHLIRATGLRDWADQFDRLVGTFGVKVNGKLRQFRTNKDADNWLKSAAGEAEIAKQGLPELVKVRVSPFGAKNDTIKQILGKIEDSPDDLSKREAQEGVMTEMLKEADDSYKGPVVLVPRHVWDHLNEHYAPATPGRKRAQMANSNFKNTVLPLSPKWLAGNIIDNSLRLIINGAGPRDYFGGKRLLETLRQIDEKDGQEFRIRTTGGMNFSTRGRMQVHRTGEDFNSYAMQQAHLLNQTKAVQLVKSPWTVYRDFVFAANQKLEHVLETAAVGRVARKEIRSAADKWEAGLRIQDKAMVDLAQGLRNTPAQIEFARKVRAIVGNWDTYGPEARKWLFDYLPFGSWLKNAMQFVYVTMPKDHPIITGLLAANNNFTREERKKLGFEPFAKGAKPDFLQGGLPYHGGVIPMQGLTSFGFAGGAGSSVASMPFAPFQSSFMAAKGLDWKGDKLAHKDGTPLSKDELLVYAPYLAAEAMIPLIALSRRIRESGGKQVGASYVWAPSVKKGSTKSTGKTLKKIFNPFEPINPKKKFAPLPGVPDFSGSSSGGYIPDFSPSSSGGYIPDLTGVK